MKNRFKFRIIVNTDVKTINGTFKGQYVYYCNGFMQGKTKTSFFGNGKKYSFLNSQIKTINQCTGLKDKNGKLIYGEDIVETWKFSTGKTKRAIVKWDYPRCGFRLFNLDSTGSSPQSMVNVTTIEIIGNIHENPELMKGE